ncbi:MAG: hypothetical protein RSB47_02440 [Ruthenibacterium sp.]
MMFRDALPTLGLIRANTFGAQKGWMHIRLEKAEAALRATVWPGPYCIEKTADDLKHTHDFSFDDAGETALRTWLGEEYKLFPKKGPKALDEELPESWKETFRVRDTAETAGADDAPF